MTNKFKILIAISLIATSLFAENYKVSNLNELNNRIQKAVPGDCIIMKEGVWENIEIVFKAKGTSKKHIILEAETPGKVFIEGASYLKISGKYLDVEGLYFKNGYSPTHTVIIFKTSDTEYAYHCKVMNCVIEKFNQPFRETADNWVSMWGKYNEVSNCYFGGKTNIGTTLIVCPDDSNSIHNKHLITNNYFGPRPRLGSNGGESIRIGTSEVCTNSSETEVKNNFFYHCNGEVEIISNKSCNNLFLNNTFLESEGSLVLRHGNHETVKGNWFIGNGLPFTGGIRIINEGHIITNNYFYKLRGDEFRSPLTIMNGIPNSPASGYAPVKNVLFANNTFYDCSLPWNFCVGVSERNRIVTPQNTWVVNNLVYCPNEKELIKSYDKTDGFTFGNNLMISKKGNLKNNGTVEGTVVNSKISGVNMIFTEAKPVENLIEKSKLHTSNNSDGFIGAFQNDKANSNEDRMNPRNYGPKWFTPDISASNKDSKGKTLHVKPGTNNLSKAVSEAENGDILLLDSGIHVIAQKITFNKNLTLKSAKSAFKPVLKIVSENNEESMFEIPSNVKIRIKGLKIEGNMTTRNAFTTAVHALNYSLFLDNCDISGFNMKEGAIFNSLYCTMADSIVISNSVLHDSYSGINLHKEKEDGKYNAETVIFNNTVFSKLTDFAIDYYRGGYDESTVGGSLSVNHCVCDSVGNDSSQAILNLSRIMYVKINNSIFSNSQAKSSFSLWYLYDKVSNSCFYNCPKPEFTKGAKSKDLFFENPGFNSKTFTLSDSSSIKGKATDGKNIGLK